MQYSSNDCPLFADYKTLPQDIPASCQVYEQTYQPDNALHYHDCIEIGLCLEGSGTQMIGNQFYYFQQNSVSVIAANCIHDSHIPMKIDEKGSVWKYIFVNPKKAGISQEDPGSFITDSPQLVSLFSLLYDEIAQKPLYYSTAFEALLSAFLVYARRITPSGPSVSSFDLPAGLATALQIIHSSYSAPFSISRLAKESNVSGSSLNRMFRSYFHTTPLSYVHNVRLAAAEHMLLHTKLPILEIASNVGFASLSAFNRAFRKQYQTSPRAFRQSGSITDNHK